jgi:hypothetical protein
MEKFIYSVSGYILGFVLSSFLWGKTEGATGVVTNLRFNLIGKEIALHHWMLFLVLLILLILFRNKFELPDKILYLALGFFIGGLNHGLTYKDWFRIVIK